MLKSASLLLALAGVLSAQPTAYTIQQVSYLFGPKVETTIYRDGSKAAIELKGGRTVYDLATNTSYSVNGPSCTVGRFSDDWGDPFTMSKEVEQANAKDIGAETINGVETRIIEVGASDGRAKAWLDPRSGLVMKAEMGRPLFEIRRAIFAPPDSSVFALPPSCTSSAPPPPAKEPDARFTNAVMPPASSGSCDVVVHVVKAGSMEPITGYRIGLENQPKRSGPLTIPMAAEHFNIDADFGSAGSASALIYRQCPSAESVLLLVVKNPSKLSDGADWFWDKTGKFSLNK